MAVVQATDTDFKELVNNNEKVIVKYYADWCGNCRLFSPKYKRMAANPDFADVSFLDVNAEVSPEARKAAGVTNLPFFAVFKNGELVDTVAASKEEAVLSLINRLN